MKDRHGNKITAGSWLMSISDQHPGEMLQVFREGRTLGFADCGSLDCIIPIDEFSHDNGCLRNFVRIDGYERKQGYDDTVTRYKDVCLQNAGTVYRVRTEELDAEQYAHLVRLGCCDPGDDEAWCDIKSLHDAGIDPDLADDTAYDKEAGLRILQSFIRPAEHYLVYAYHHRWTGADGYKLVNDVLDTLPQNGDVILHPVSVSASGKTLICVETSHDVPTGSTVVICALSRADYNRLSRCRNWEDIKNFAGWQLAKADKQSYIA